MKPSREWMTFATCGAFGWYQVLVSASIFPHFFNWWISFIISIAAIALGIRSLERLDPEIRRIALKRVLKKNGPSHSKLIDDCQDQEAKRIYRYVIIWATPLIWGMFGGMFNRFE